MDGIEKKVLGSQEVSLRERYVAITIVRVSNGWAVYRDLSTGYDINEDSRMKPLAVFQAPGDMLKWVDQWTR